MNRRSILAAYKKKSSHLQTGVTGFKSGNLFNDDIAAAVAACGLIELASLVPDRQDEYLTPALKMLHALDDPADWDEARDGYLQYCSADYHGKEHNVNFTYGDYYFYEALLKLTGDEIFLW